MAKMSLKAITSGVIEAPLRIGVVGTEGIGKSTFAASAPAAVFISTERGTQNLDVERFPEAESWQDVLDAIQCLTDDKHAYATLVIDTVDWLESLCWAHVCRQAGVQDIEAFGYGKGYVAATAEWRRLLAKLDALSTARNMHIILVGHVHIRTFQDPATDASYDRYEPKLHKGASGLIKEWVDCLLFAREDVSVLDKTRRGIGHGRRLFTERTPAYDAKNRQGLPASLPLSWSAFWEAVQAGRNAVPGLRAELEALLPQLLPADAKKVGLWLKTDKAKNADQLRSAINRAQLMVPDTDKEDDGA